MSKQKRKKELTPRTSAGPVKDQVAWLRQLFPECITEGKIDFDKLRATLGEEVDSRPERYSFSWAGKRDAIRLLQTPSRATLIPAEKESVNFDETGHLFIEGDNLEVLKLLYKPYFGRVKMIYIDPPYNTGNDFIYPDNFADPLDIYLKLTGQKSAEGNLLTSNPETSGRYHSAWLSMMYPRLFLARQLLREDGVIFVSIDDREVHNLRLLMNEIFGEENFIAKMVWQSKKGGGGDVSTIVGEHEYLLVYARQNSPDAVGRQAIDSAPLDQKDEKGLYRKGRELNKWGAGSARADRPTMFFPIPGPDGEEVYPIRNDGAEGRWRWGKDKMLKIVAEGNALFERRPDGTYIVYEKIRTQDPRYKAYRTLLTEVGTVADGTAELKELFGGKSPFEFPKPVSLIKHLLRVAGTEETDLVVDFFAGSCTTAQAVLELNREDDGNRHFIMVQLPEPVPEDSPARKAGYKTISEIGKERIRRVIEKMRKENDDKLDLKTREMPEDLGFEVFKLAESNYKPWTGVEEKEPDAYAKTMELFIDPLVSGWKPENVIWEVAIKEGYGLNARVELVSGLKGNTVYRVIDPDKGQSFRICLDDALKPATLKVLNLRKDDLFICRDAALDDEGTANLALQCRLKTI